jgi:hypothetical protein
MFLLGADHGGLIKPDGNQTACKQITRQGKDVGRAKWHDFVLTPSAKTSNANDFVLEMCKQEKEFIDDVKSKFAIA